MVELQWNIDDSDLFRFYLEKDNKNVALEKWPFEEPVILDSVSILLELLENGLAESDSSSIKVPSIEILNLEQVERKTLGLPETYPFVLKIEPKGVIASPTFKCNFGFFTFSPNGRKIEYKISGPLISKGETAYLLTNRQYKAIKRINEHDGLGDGSRSLLEKYQFVKELQEVVDDEEVVLDGYLKSLSIEELKGIEINPVFNDGVLELIPEVPNDQLKSFASKFDRSSRIKSIYNLQGENETQVKLLIKPEIEGQLLNVKKHRKVTDPILIQSLVYNPETIFDAHTVNLDLFSERVREIGLYKPKFYPFISPYKSEWIPGFTIRDKKDGVKKVRFKTEEELREFEEAIQSAKNDKGNVLRFKGIEIPIKDAEVISEVASRQFQNPKTPITKSKDLSINNVLIIKENADLLEYIETSDPKAYLEHKFENVENFKQGWKLKEHQIEGVSWMQSLIRKDFGGGLLADDMGLGKTIQLLYLIEWHAQTFHTSPKPYLIVAPVSLLENWQAEYRKFFQPKSLEIKVVSSSTFSSKELFMDDVDLLRKKQLLLTNYETLRNYQLTMCAVEYAIVAVDEAQKIKTPGTLITNSVKALNADFKIAMTGTPVENTLVDLWCIMDFCVPGLLGDAKEFAKRYQNPFQEASTNIVELGDQLRLNIGVFLKRRLKEHVAKELPEKKIKVDKRAMPQAQFSRYVLELDLAKESRLHGVENRNQILKTLWALRDISDHPYLKDKQFNQISSNDLISTSAKLMSTVDILKEVQKKDEKAIIFVDRKLTQRLLRKVIYDTFHIAPPSIINGDSPASQKKVNSGNLSRQQTIDRFEQTKGFNVLIMSPIAAGVGLNVTAANHVIHYSRHWNPAKEEQATDRAYRIGQNKNVIVYYPMAIFPDSPEQTIKEKPKSFDQVLDELLAKKKALAKNTLFPTEQTEVKIIDIYERMFNTPLGDEKGEELNIDDLDQIMPHLFEASIASFYQRQGFNVHLSPMSNDKGADVVALGTDVNYLVQVKQSKSKISNDAVQEIVAASDYYKLRFEKDFQPVVVSNSQLSRSAFEIARANNVKIIERNELMVWCEKYPLNNLDLQRIELQRMQSV